jgi:predicted transcriptional regulator
MSDSDKKKNLTEVELEMMNIVWSVGPCTVHQILDALPVARQLAYTSVSTMVRILEQKGYLKAMKDGRGHIYQAIIPKDDYEASALQQMVHKLFDGEPSLLVHRLLSTQGMTQEDLKSIEQLIRQRRAR